MRATVTVAVDPAIPQLLRATAKALRGSRMEEALEALNDRFMAADRLFEVTSGPTVRLRPMAELVLREVAAVAADRRLDEATRTRRVIEALDLAGY